jgi:hypothetical protein
MEVEADDNRMVQVARHMGGWWRQRTWSEDSAGCRTNGKEVEEGGQKMLQAVERRGKIMEVERKAAREWKGWGMLKKVAEECCWRPDEREGR